MNLKRETHTGIGGVGVEHRCVYTVFIYKILKKKVNELTEPWIFPVCLDFGKQYFPWKKGSVNL